jgi:hypothetical protein
MRQCSAPCLKRSLVLSVPFLSALFRIANFRYWVSGWTRYLVKYPRGRFFHQFFDG